MLQSVASFFTKCAPIINHIFLQCCSITKRYINSSSRSILLNSPSCIIKIAPMNSVQIPNLLANVGIFFENATDCISVEKKFIR